MIPNHREETFSWCKKCGESLQELHVNCPNQLCKICCKIECMDNGSVITNPSSALPLTTEQLEYTIHQISIHDT